MKQYGNLSLSDQKHTHVIEFATAIGSQQFQDVHEPLSEVSLAKGRDKKKAKTKIKKKKTGKKNWNAVRRRDNSP